MAYWVGASTTKASAPTLTTSETILATCDSSASEQSGRKNSFHTLRVKRLAAAIDITAAGTSAPIAIAAKATPRNQDGNMSANSAGTAVLGSVMVSPAAIAM